MKSVTIILLILIPTYGVLSQTKNVLPTQERNVSIPKVNPADNYTYSIFPVAQSQFGYDILQNNKLLIHQPQIPGISGNKGFETSVEAEKVATLMIEKIRKGIFPPTVTIDELKNLKIKVE